MDTMAAKSPVRIGPSERLPPKVRAAHVRAWPLHELGPALARNPIFREQVAAVAAGEQSAAAVAKLYCPDSPQPRRALEKLIGLAASRYRTPTDYAGPITRDRLWLLVEDALVNAAPDSCWVDAPLDPGEPQRSLNAHARLRSAVGARLVSRRGAGRLCLRCEARLSGDPETRRQKRIVYCWPCESGPHASDHKRHTDLLHLTLARVADAMGTTDRVAQQRIRRAAA